MHEVITNRNSKEIYDHFKTSIYEQLGDSEFEFSSAHSIGRGGFGAVYMGWKKSEDHERVAVKILHNNNKFATDAEVVAFEKVLGEKLKHKHLVNCLALVKHEGTIAFVMEYCSGGNLYNHIAQRMRNKKCKETGSCRCVAKKYSQILSTPSASFPTRPNYTPRYNSSTATTLSIET